MVDVPGAGVLQAGSQRGDAKPLGHSVEDLVVGPGQGDGLGPLDVPAGRVGPCRPGRRGLRRTERRNPAFLPAIILAVEVQVDVVDHLPLFGLFEKAEPKPRLLAGPQGGVQVPPAVLVPDLRQSLSQLLVADLPVPVCVHLLRLGVVEPLQRFGLPVGPLQGAGGGEVADLGQERGEVPDLVLFNRLGDRLLPERIGGPQLFLSGDLFQEPSRPIRIIRIRGGGVFLEAEGVRPP